MILITSYETYSQKVDMAKNTRQVSKELDAERDLLNIRRKKVNADEKAVQAVREP